MTSKKKFATTVAMFIALTVAAQPDGYKDPKKLDVYVRIYGAYGFLTPGSYKGNPYLLGGEPVRFKDAKNGMGNGIYTGASVGIILNEFWNVGVAGEYLVGDKIHIQQNITAKESKEYRGSGYSLEASRTYGYKIASIIPNLTFKAIAQYSYYIYSRLGLQIGIPLNMTESYFQHYHYHNDNAGTHTIMDRDITITYKGKHSLKIGLGYQFSTGIQFILTEKIRGFFEIAANRSSYSRDKYEDIDRVRIQIETNRDELPQPTIYDYSKFKYIYINSGPTGTNVRGVANNYLTTYRFAQEPVIVNSLTAGLGLSYIF